ncbi:MAG: hypothetical protein HN348_11425 [Proteobacteria bacterium]|nr:hypothetical protein [Pseudomonadota bacterium]
MFIRVLIYFPFVFAFAFLFAVPEGQAMQWAVEDEEAAQELTEALDELWPGHDIEVFVGDLGDEQEGLVTVGGDVTWVRPQMATRTVGEDPRVAVVAVRAWVRELVPAETSTNESPEEPLADEPKHRGYFVLSTGWAIQTQQRNSFGSKFSLGWHHRGWSLMAHLFPHYSVTSEMTRKERELASLLTKASTEDHLSSAYASMPVYRDYVSLGITADWDFGISRNKSEGMVVGPMALIGVEVHHFSKRVPIDTTDTIGLRKGWDFGPTMGMGVFFKAGRGMMCLHISAAMRTYDGQITVEPRLTFETRGLLGKWKK